LDNRQLLITNEEVISPTTLKKVEGEGMPILNSENKGDLYISFDITFPEFIPEESKALLRKGLEDQEQI
jgi:DnaJ-class molecular chaperone